MKPNQTTLNDLIESLTDYLYELEIIDTLVIVTIIPETTKDLLIYTRDDGIEIARQEIPPSNCLQDTLTFTSHFDGDRWITLTSSLRDRFTRCWELDFLLNPLPYKIFSDHTEHKFWVEQFSGPTTLPHLVQMNCNLTVGQTIFVQL